jgi:hypothetical protein
LIFPLDVAVKVDISKEKLTDAMPELGLTEGFDVELEMSGVP